MSPYRFIRFALFAHFPFFSPSFSLVLLYSFFVRWTFVGVATKFMRHILVPFLPAALLLQNESRSSAVAVGGTFALLHRIPVKLITSGERALGYLIRATNS